MGLKEELVAKLSAGMSGLWVHTYENQEVVRALRDIAVGRRSEREVGFDQPSFLGVWDVDKGLSGFYGESSSASHNEVRSLTAAIEAFPELPGAVLGGQKLPKNTMQILVLKNAHMFFDPVSMQVLENAIEKGKASYTAYVIVATQVKVPPTLEKLINIVEHPLPTPEELIALASSVLEGVSDSPQGPGQDELNGPNKEEWSLIGDALAGLSTFEAENAVELSIYQHDAIQPELLWELKAQMLKKSQGLSLYRGEENFDKLGGMRPLKDFCLKLLKKRNPSPSLHPKGVLCVGVPGAGKCLARGTEVIMANGSVRKVEDIVEGDLVQGPGGPQKVVNLDRGFGPLFSVTLLDGTRFHVTENHVLSYLKQGRKETATATELVGRKRECFDSWWSKAEFPERRVPLDPYLAGCIIAGSDKEGRSVWMRKSQEFYDLITGLGYIPSIGTLDSFQEIRAQDANGDWIVFHRALGLENWNPEEPDIPDEYAFNSDNVRHAFLRGFLDARGVKMDSAMQIISCKRGKQMKQLLRMTRLMGLHVESLSRMNQYSDVPGVQGPYTLIWKPGPCAMSSYIQPAGRGEYFGFELDGDQLFYLGNGVVTHNSAFAKALGKATQRPTILMDVGAMMGSLVGETEHNVRNALRTVDAMAPAVLLVDEVEKAFAGGGSSGNLDSGVSARMFGSMLTWLSDHTSDVFTMVTSNNISLLPPEFARAERFDALYFFDLPTSEEREAIWQIYLKMYGLEKQKRVRINDADWTGAEIRECCRLAAIMECSLSEASMYIVPYARTSAEPLKNLREWANGRCLSTSSPGLFNLSKREQTVSVGGRKVTRKQS